MDKKWQHKLQNSAITIPLVCGVCQMFLGTDGGEVAKQKEFLGLACSECSMSCHKNCVSGAPKVPCDLDYINQQIMRTEIFMLPFQDMTANSLAVLKNFVILSHIRGVILSLASFITLFQMGDICFIDPKLVELKIAPGETCKVRLDVQVNDVPLLEYYIIEQKKLGDGGFGDVWLAHDSLKRSSFAIKRIDKAKQLLNVQREIRAGLRLHHKNIVKFIQHFEDEDHDYLVFEYLEGSDLFSFCDEREFRPMDEKEARKIFLQIVEAIVYCHKNGVVHLDIKLDNVMINPDKGSIHLIDFGLCDFIIDNQDKLKRPGGSVDYCPPELLAIDFKKRDSFYSGIKVDVWCMGILLYILLNSSFPFDKSRVDLVKRGGIARHPALHFFEPISKPAEDFLRKMLEIDPQNRISMDEVVKHPWLVQE